MNSRVLIKLIIVSAILFSFLASSIVSICDEGTIDAQTYQQLYFWAWFVAAGGL